MPMKARSSTSCLAIASADPNSGLKKVEAYLAGLSERGEALPARAERPTEPWYGEIERRAGCFPLFLSKPAGETARKLVDAAAQKLGVAARRPVLEREVVTLNAAGGGWMERIRRDHEERGEYVGPALGDARRLLTLMERRFPAGAAVAVDDAIASLETAVADGKIRQSDDIRELLSDFKTFLATLSPRLDLPATFHGALEVAMAAAGLSPAALAKQLGVNATMIVRWRSGERVPDERNGHLVAKIEQQLGLAAGELSQRIERRRAGRGSVAKGAFPPELQTQKLMGRRSEIARRLPADVMCLGQEDRHELMRKINAEIDAEVAERAARNALRRDSYALKDWPAGAREEFASFADFKISLIPECGLQRFGERNRPTTMEMRRQHIAQYFGYLATRAEDGGRIDESDTSLVLLVIPSLLENYLVWKSFRTVTADRRLTATDTDFLTLAASLVRPIDGFLRQRPDLRQRVNPILAKYALKIAGRDGREWTSVEEKEWALFCDDVLHAIKAFERTLRHVVKQTKRFRELKPILDLPDPLSVVYRAVDTMRRDLAKLDSDSLAYARLQRGLVIFHISTQVAMRTETWVALTAASDGPDIRNNNGTWHLHIPASKIKTGDVAARFKDDPFYRRTLLDDAGLYGDIEEYLEKSRPSLLGARRFDGFLVNNEARPAFTKAYFSNVVRGLVVRYISKYSNNDNASLGLDDFSIHPFRHILATTILKRTGSYELAGDALADDPETIRQYYGSWRSNDRAQQLLDALGKRKLNKPKK
ncbi:hypothetical protein [Jiella avicenniae]|uniref:HTH cro/C1-type domain-containing protein n=1 Tax=Jiella avicenniae TaxID=2907202 RepID=A0A9X1TE58_9HYPH|nr:hypothetical protein [Jiella avicenniae]MCE7030943.1 hypothetical protein [Jiella avicenniae]